MRKCKFAQQQIAFFRKLVDRKLTDNDYKVAKIVMSPCSYLGNARNLQRTFEDNIAKVDVLGGLN